jgi:ribosomal protein L29
MKTKLEPLRKFLLNLQAKNNFEGVQKPSQKDHLSINVMCVRTLTLNNRKKA